MITLTKLTETADYILLGWPPVQGATGYRFSSSLGGKKTHTWDPNYRRDAAFPACNSRFQKGASWYKVEALGVAAEGQYPPVAPPLPSTSTPIGALRICTNCVASGGDLSRYRYIWMNAWDYTRIPALKAANPSIKTLVYKDMASTRSYAAPGELIPAGIDYHWANANHSDWFSLNSSGNRIEWGTYPGSWQMDIGNVAYQNQWALNVIAELRANGWAGVAVDNAMMDPVGIYYDSPSREYPTQAAYQAATRAFLANVGPTIMAAGFLFLPNIQPHGYLAPPSLWSDWIQFTSGAIREFYTKWGTGTSLHHGGAYWAETQATFDAVQNAGKIFLPITYAPKTDTRSIRYAWASFLLKWNGGSSAFVFEPMPEAQDPWSPEWTTSIGTPTAPALQVGIGWKRTFSGGTVYVNPSESASVTIDSHILAPMSGLVLRAP